MVYDALKLERPETIKRKIDDWYNQKRNRLNTGQPPRVLDLFGGCGGLSLGFKSRGYDIVAAVEVDEAAAQSHARNFHSDQSPEKHQAKDILKTEPVELVRELGLHGDTASHIDVIIGGPPCQAFTRIGRAKLREVKSDINAYLNDSRSQLYKRYLYYVDEFRPLVILMENVPDILNYGGKNIADDVCEDLAALGYKCAYTLLNTVYYGVPQMRERMFLIGLHESIASDIVFPLPTHAADLPRGYHGSRNVALQSILRESEHRYFRKPPVADMNFLLPAVTAEDALSDLPILTDHLQCVGGRRNLSNINDRKNYSEMQSLTDYQLQMRNWERYSTNESVSSNVIRHLPRDFPIFRRMSPGDQYPEALKIANELFREKLGQFLGPGVLKENDVSFDQLKKVTVPPYSDAKFPNKWRKMEADKPSRTLMAHLGKDSYSHIHYDSEQARTISVREAARLQSFPDGFEFAGAMNAAFRQIGNAVPPLMASHLAESIREMLSIGGR